MICITPVLFGYNDQNYVNSPQKLEESVSIFDENDDGDIITEEKTDEVNIGGLSEVLLKGFGIFTNNQSKSKHDPTVDDFNINEKIEYSDFYFHVEFCIALYPD